MEREKRNEDEKKKTGKNSDPKNERSGKGG